MVGEGGLGLMNFEKVVLPGEKMFLEIINNNKVVVFGNDYCALDSGMTLVNRTRAINCANIKKERAWLDSRKIPYTYIDINEHPELNYPVSKRGGFHRDLPQTIIGKELVPGGYDGLIESHESGKLKRLLDKVGITY